MSILQEIAEHSRSRVAEARRETPLRILEQSRFWVAPRKSPVTSLKQSTLSVIAEFKRRSPSGSQESKHTVAEVASGYEKNGAAAMSVLTEPAYFGGNLEDLEIARRSCDLPLLRKDFIIDEYQIVEARAHGADMVLLIAAILSKQQMDILVQTCLELDLEPLVELYASKEIDLIPMDNVRLVGANNRDLRTFEIDTQRAPDILSHIPADKVRIAESGLRTIDDLRDAHSAGLDAALIGTHLMSTPDPGIALGELLNKVIV